MYGDDEQFRNEVIQSIKCIPIYWKRFNANHNAYPDCIQQHQLKQADDHINSYRKILTAYDSPCLEMDISAVQVANEQNPRDEILVKFVYVDDTFNEVINIQEFGFESLWSSVGGFVGIFLGYSLLQLPELLKVLVSMSLRLMRGSKPK